MRISVIIPVFNRADFITRAIESVLNQTEAPAEILIVDDGSTDRTNAMLQSYADQVTLIRHDENRGVSAARNSGIHAAETEWLAFLDSDDQWVPDKLEHNRRFHEQNPSYKIFQNEEVWIRHGRRVNPRNRHKKYAGRIFRQSLPLCIISPSAVVINKEVFNTAGLFDETFPVCEDYDLWLRVTLKYAVGLDSHPGTVKYGGHTDQLSRRYPAMDLWRIRAMRKHLDDKVLTGEDRDFLIRELKKKLVIYLKGADRRLRSAQEEKDLLRHLNHLQRESGSQSGNGV